MAGLIVRQGRLLVLAVLVAAAFAPDAIRAQDVIVFAPSATASTASTATTPSANDDAPLLVREPSPIATTAAVPSAVSAAAAAAAAMTPPGTKYVQCATDADCVLLDDGCKSATVVNQRYVADANAGMAHEAACRPAATASPVGIKATCRNGMCGLLPGRVP
jgi:hypothetical protein